MKKILLDDIQFEPWASTCHVGAMYKGKPFTGIAEQIEENIYLKYYYKAGKAHGRWYEFNQKTGEVLYDGIFKNNTKVGEHTMAYEGFKRVMHFDRAGNSVMEKKWNPQGILIKHYDETLKIDEEYYNDGGLYLINKKHRDNRIHRFYYLGKKSLWILKEGRFNSKKSKFLYQFNHDLLKEKFDHLTSAFHLDIIRWYIEHLIETDKRRAFTFIKKCLAHLDPLFQIIAANESANLSNSKLIPYLEKLNNKKKLCSLGNYGCVISYGSLHWAGKKAIRSIKKNTTIKNKT